MKSYKEKNYEQALIETYLKFDELLRDEKVNNFLKMNSKNRAQKFDYDTYGLEVENGNSEHDVRSREISLSDSPKAHAPKDMPQSSTPEGPHVVLKEVIKTPRSSTKSIPASDGSGSVETLTLDNHKLEISLRRTSSGSNSEELIATNMGTTANILLLKNNYLYVANTGDSMAVLYKNGQAVRLNQEHKPSLPSEFTRISKSGAKILNNRIEGRLNLTRAIGTTPSITYRGSNF